MPKKQPHYSVATQRSAVEQVLHQGRPIAQVARQLHCSDQSIQRWIKLHQHSLPPPTPSTAFLPIRVDGQHTPSSIELVTKTGLTLRFSADTPTDTLFRLIRQLEDRPC